MSPKKMTHEEWEAEGKRRFGEDQMQWKFVCPICGHIQSVQDYKDAGAPSNVVAFSCIRRWILGSRRAFGGNGAGPCDYAGGVLFRCNPIEIDGQTYFDFAPEESDTRK
jgi:hypothetical protein